MNYQQIYNSLCERGKNRSKNEGIYYEKHHIIPTFFFIKNKRNLRHNDGIIEGDCDCKSNITLLTPREHFIAHLLLHKIYFGTKWSHRCGSSLILFFNKIDSKHQRNLVFNPGMSNKYDWAYDIARKSVSESKKGKIVVKNKDGVIIGAVDNTHPFVISGEWVHHTKGRIISSEERLMKSEQQSGSKNNNYKELTIDRRRRLFNLIEKSTIRINDDDYIHSEKLLTNMKLEFTEFKKLSMVWIRNNFGSVAGLVSVFNNEMSKNIKYKRYGKSNL